MAGGHGLIYNKGRGEGVRELVPPSPPPPPPVNSGKCTKAFRREHQKAGVWTLALEMGVSSFSFLFFAF